jgi:hypothetical protein
MVGQAHMSPTGLAEQRSSKQGSQCNASTISP